MALVDDPGYYFQTDAAIASGERKAAKSKNQHGTPIKLPSKILAVIPSPDSNVIYVAEAAGQVSRVNTETNNVERLASPAQAPLTCLAICPSTQTLFTGCWDKTIYGIPLTPSQPRRKLSGHSDFVKCLLTTSLSGRPLLLSGGADAVIIVWDIPTGTILHKLKGHTKAPQALSIDPTSISAAGDSCTVFSASSDREIRRWHISTAKAHELPDPIAAHETSVYALTFEQAADGEGDLWTGSADKTARRLVRERDWEADTTLVHPDFVRAVAVDERRGLVVTACRDEEVRVWDVASGELLCMYSGHFEEVTGIVLQRDHIVSVSIDATVRKWPLDRREMEKYQQAQKADASMDKEVHQTGAESMLTAEEEAELAALMDDDDD